MKIIIEYNDNQVLLHSVQSCSEAISWGVHTDSEQSGGVTPPPRVIDSWIETNFEDNNGW